MRKIGSPCHLVFDISKDRIDSMLTLTILNLPFLLDEFPMKERGVPDRS
jgi:hypothetical protein